MASAGNSNDINQGSAVGAASAAAAAPAPKEITLRLNAIDSKIKTLVVPESLTGAGLLWQLKAEHKIGNRETVM